MEVHYRQPTDLIQSRASYNYLSGLYLSFSIFFVWSVRTPIKTFRIIQDSSLKWVIFDYSCTLGGIGHWNIINTSTQGLPYLLAQKLWVPTFIEM